MFIRVLPEEVTLIWDELSPWIEEALPSPHRDDFVMTSILSSLLQEVAYAWLLYDDDKKAIATVITTFQRDDILKKKYLLIYALNGFEFIKPKYYLEALIKLREFAKSTNCVDLIAYTEHIQYAEWLEQMFGVGIETRLLSIGL